MTIQTYDFGPVGLLQPLKPLNRWQRFWDEDGELIPVLGGAQTPESFFNLVDSLSSKRDAIGFPRYPRRFLERYCPDRQFRAAVGRYWREAHALHHAELLAVERLTDYFVNLLMGALKMCLYVGIGVGLLTVMGQVIPVDAPTAGCLVAIWLMLWIFDALMSAAIFPAPDEIKFRIARERLERLKLEQARAEVERG